MPQREPRQVQASAHVTVFTAEGVAVKYPKAQVARLEDSTSLFLDDPTDVDPGEAPKPKPEPKAKKPTANAGSKK